MEANRTSFIPAEMESEVTAALDAHELEWVSWHQARIAKGGKDGESSRRILEAWSRRNQPQY